MTAGPLMQMLFPPVPLIEQVHRTPMLIFGVLEECLAIAFFSLWRGARDYRVFRTLGYFYVIVGSEQFLQYFGGYNPPVWSLRALAVALLVEAAGDAMQVPRRRWTRIFWPVYLFAGVATWFPGMSFVNDLPALGSEIMLGILIFLGFRRGNLRDRLVAAAFTVHFVVRLTISQNFQHLTGMKNYAVIGGWQWQYTTTGITGLGAATLAILVRDLMIDRAEKQRLGAELAASRPICDAGWLQWVGGLTIYYPTIIVIAVASFLDKSPEPVFPRWFGYFNFWSALLLIPASLITFFKTGPFCWSGILGFYLGVVVFTAWCLVTFGLLVKAIQNHPKTANG